jgi:hypothetical protein
VKQTIALLVANIPELELKNCSGKIVVMVMKWNGVE